MPFIATLLVALLMGSTLAHALEMPAKMQATAAQWLGFQHTLYRSFATIGGPIEIGAIALTSLWAYGVRTNRTVLLMVTAAALFLGIGFFVIWLGFTNPVNARTAAWTQQTIPHDWAKWRTQWEYSHLVRFALHLFAFSVLLLAMLRQRG